LTKHHRSHWTGQHRDPNNPLLDLIVPIGYSFKKIFGGHLVVEMVLYLGAFSVPQPHEVDAKML